MRHAFGVLLFFVALSFSVEFWIPGSTTGFRTCDLAVRADGTTDSGSHADFITEWGLLGYLRQTRSRHGYDQPWQESSEVQPLPLVLTIGLTGLVWLVPVALLRGKADPGTEETGHRTGPGW